MTTKRLVLPLVLLLTTAALQAQSFYMINKSLQFVQTSATGVAPDPLGTLKFHTKAATNVTLALPGGASAPAFSVNNKDGGFRFDQSFPTKAALDAAFPNGIYRMTGAAISALSLDLAVDNYPITNPQVISVSNGSWNSGGILVVDPAQSLTLNFSTFAGYATSGVAGHINFAFVSMTDGAVDISTDLFSRSVLGSPAQPTPLTSYTIPAGTLVSGHVYRAWLDFDTVTAMDTTAVAGKLVGGLFSKEVSFYVAAQSPGTSTIPPPVIIATPTSATGVVGGSATFSMAFTVGGVRTNFQDNPNNVQFGYSWTHNGQDLNDIVYAGGGKYSVSNAETLTINSLTAADAGDYTVTIFTAGGVVTSLPATLTFSNASAPAITAQPRGATVNAGSTLALTATATGTPTPTYQWNKDGAPIIGATADTLVLPGITASAAGSYTVSVSNANGSVVSAAAVVVVTSGQPSRLPNLSVRANLAASQTLIVGFVSEGDKNMLVRAMGPTLATLGLPVGFLPDPTIELHNTSSVVAANNDWDASLTAVFAEFGAQPFLTASKDAALQQVINGPHTAHIKSVGSGVVLVEVYDAGGSGKLVNVAARNLVGTGDNIMIAGFVLSGTAAKTLLIRGVGAKLVEYGVTNVLADPKLEIFNEKGVKIAENDSWNALLQPVASRVGAFALTLGSRDAALLITLPPGVYTAQVSGVGGTTGEAMVEVYDVP